MNELQIFNSDEFGEIRTVEIDGKPYFVGADVAKALGYKDTVNALKQHCRGVVKHHLIFSFPQRWRRSQRCWEYPSKHRRDRCKRRALLDYFNRRCLYHHTSQPDTPPFMFDFVFILHLMFLQQAAGIYI